MPPLPPPMIAWFATKGSGTNEAKRIETLLSRMSPAVELPFRKSAKAESFRVLWRLIVEKRPKLLVMEGTGIAGGLACLGARIFHGVPYVFSSGDAVGPFVRGHNVLAGLIFDIYERLLCRFSAGFIGWTPYLCGRAMAFGAPRAVTAPGWVIGGHDHSSRRAEMRRQFGIPEDKLVVGLLGALDWNNRRQWCYGYDLVKAAHRLARKDLCILVVGDGSGLPYLRDAAGDLLGERVFLPGPVPLEMVMPALSAMDVASLPQTVDGIGMYRYTTKLPEYAAARLPVITNQIPMAYDLGGGWTWRMPGENPWDVRHLDALAKLLDSLDPAAVAAKRAHIPDLETIFDRDAQIERVTEFLSDILAARK